MYISFELEVKKPSHLQGVIYRNYKYYNEGRGRAGAMLVNFPLIFLIGRK